MWGSGLTNFCKGPDHVALWPLISATAVRLCCDSMGATAWLCSSNPDLQTQAKGPPATVCWSLFQMLLVHSQWTQYFSRDGRGKTTHLLCALSKSLTHRICESNTAAVVYPCCVWGGIYHTGIDNWTVLYYESLLINSVLKSKGPYNGFSRSHV